MCDQDSFNDMIRHLKRDDALTRRRFGALSMAQGLLAALPRTANATGWSSARSRSRPPTAPPTHLRPSRQGGKARRCWVWTDIFGLVSRVPADGPALPESGYAVLTPNPFLSHQTRRPRRRARACRTKTTLNAVMALAHAGRRRPMSRRASLHRLARRPGVGDAKRKMAPLATAWAARIVMRTAANFADHIETAARSMAKPGHRQTRQPNLLVAEDQGEHVDRDRRQRRRARAERKVALRGLRQRNRAGRDQCQTSTAGAAGRRWFTTRRARRRPGAAAGDAEGGIA